MNVLNKCDNTSTISVFGVLLAGTVYSYAAYESFTGKYPGAYTPLAMLAPILLLANNYTLLMSVIKSILPTVTTRVFFGLALLGGALFQAACAARYDLRIILALAVGNFLAYMFIAFVQNKLDRKSLVLQCKSQQALSAVVNEVIDKKNK